MAKLRVDVIAGVGTTSANTVFQGEVEFDSQNFLTIPKGTTTDRNRTGGRGLFGERCESQYNTIYFINTSSGIADFGDLTTKQNKWFGDVHHQLVEYLPVEHMDTSPAPPFSRSNVIDYVTFATTGNAVRFWKFRLIQPDLIYSGLSNQYSNVIWRRTV